MRPTPTHTVTAAETVRTTREKATATTPRIRAPAAGNSIGFITRLRMRRLVSGSPVAWSAQVWTVHSTSTMPSAIKPNTSSGVDDTRPMTTSATPKADTAGQ